MYIYKHQLLSVFTPIYSKGSINKNLGYPCLLQQVVTTTHRCLHPINIPHRDGNNKDMSLKLLTQNYLNKNWGKFMHLIQNKRLQTRILLFYYYFEFLPGWLICDHKPHVFVCSAAASCWLPIIQILSGTTTRETRQSQPSKESLKKCLSLNFHHHLSSPLSLSSFASTPPCSALLPSKQTGWGDRYRRSTSLYPGHTYCSLAPFFIPCLAL